MSRAFIIRVAEVERRFIRVEDAVCSDIELLPILPAARLSELLAAELESRGFAVKDGTARRQDGDVAIEVDLATARVSARSEASENVERTAQARIQSTSAQISAEKEARTRTELREELEAGLAADTARLQKAATAKLEATLADLLQELSQVSNRVAGAALKEKAAQLGEVLEIAEDESGAMTIKVKV